MKSFQIINIMKRQDKKLPLNKAVFSRLTRLTGLILGPALLLCLGVQVVSHPGVLLAGDADAFIRDSAVFENMTPDFTVSESFSSHLPLLVIEAGQSESGSVNRPAQLTVYAASSGQNSLSNPPEATAEIFLTEGGLSTETGKMSYVVKAAGKTGGASLAKISLAGLPEAEQWRLHGSLADKGMLRNGLAYALGRAIFPDSAPQSRYCEVLFKIDGRYFYQGLYILAESSIEIFKVENNAKDDGFLLKYTPEQDKVRQGDSQPGGDESFLSKTLNDRGFSVVFPPTEQMTLELRAESELDSLENSLHSLSPGTFLKYLSIMDQKSAIDLYILNEMLLNADDAPVQFYLAGSKKGSLTFQPVWDFDRALDNAPVRANPLAFEEDAPDIPNPSILSRKVPVWRQLESGGDIRDLRLYPLYTAMNGDSYLWFDRLFLSRPFLVDLLDRYHELRRGPLSPEKVSAAVDDLARELGPALARDWRRWSEVYDAHEGPYALASFTDAKGRSLNRQTVSYDQELVKIRYLLRRQDALFMEQTAQLDRLSADMFDKATSGNRRAGYALATLIAFLFMTYLLTRKV